ncbi:type I restriction endonuclease [Streptococcus oralis subsp. oralis]|uniref:Type I restriction endonuclease n=1 Tax=Streptococcus oralis subsp. oralis TaxID=1891914 RepID=A0A1X1GXA6_STROR|nr:restriction endonuclease subunit S [Streptococcus oralis]ORO51497.1 type I restriction endonuclease [Streptococcus oralis subsp. oralis]
MSEWKALSSITSKIGSGSTPRGGNSVYSDSGISFIRSQNVLDMDFSTENLAFINDNQAEKLNNVIVEKNDILLNITGDSIARCTVVPEEILPARVNQHVSIIRCKNTEESKYVMYYLQYMKKYLLQISKVGGTRNALTKEAIGKLPIKISDDCNEISKILDNIDQKIQINNQINQELEAMAKTLYDYWFVQFDFPDQNGKPYKSSGGKMVYNPELKRDMPEGWGVEKLGELAQFKNGINYEKTSSGSEKVKIINVRNISSSTIFINQTDLDEIFLENDKSTNFIVNEGMILITRSGIPGATRLVSELEAKTVYSGFIIASEVNDLINKNLIFYYLKNVEEVLKNQSAGTIMKNISQSVLTDMIVSLPPQNVLLKFNSIIDNLLEQMKNVQRQNQELTQLRDWLLPMLMNGQVRVENYTD